MKEEKMSNKKTTYAICSLCAGCDPHCPACSGIRSRGFSAKELFKELKKIFCRKKNKK